MVFAAEKETMENKEEPMENKEKPFKAIKKNGYKWNEETKTLEKLIKQNKFHKFEWLCANEPYKYARFIQILEIVNSCYRVSKDLGQEEGISEFRFIEKYFHKYDIRDAKEGDVLCYKGEVFILKNCVPFDKIVYHCCYDGEYFIPNSIYSLTKDDFNKIHPATKEQRALLFRKMKEACYKWNEETKTIENMKDKTKRADNVNRPRHYTSHPSGVECIEITRHYCFAIGNAIKYLWRAGLKEEEGMSGVEKEIEDLRKAVWYIQDRIAELEMRQKNDV